MESSSTETAVGGAMDEYALSDALHRAVTADLVQPVNAAGGLYPAAITRVDATRGVVFLDENATVGPRFATLKQRFEELRRANREIELTPTRVYYYATLVRREHNAVVLCLGRRPPEPAHLRGLGPRLVLGVLAVLVLYQFLHWLTVVQS